MGRVVIDIKDNEKGKYLLDFLRQIDFLEITEDIGNADVSDRKENKKNLEEVFLNAPVLSEEEIQNVENVGKEFKNWKTDEF